MQIVYLSSWPTGGAEKMVNYQRFLDPLGKHAKNVNMSTNTLFVSEKLAQKHFKLADKHQKLV